MYFQTNVLMAFVKGTITWYHGNPPFWECRDDQKVTLAKCFLLVLPIWCKLKQDSIVAITISVFYCPGSKGHLNVVNFQLKTPQRSPPNIFEQEFYLTLTFYNHTLPIYWRVSIKLLKTVGYVLKFYQTA